MSETVETCFWYTKENWCRTELKGWELLTSYWCADLEGITSCTLRACADRYVIGHHTHCRHTTCTRTWILTFVTNTGSIHCTVWTYKTFWPTTFIRVSVILWYALTHSKWVLYTTTSIWSTRWWVAWISCWWWWRWSWKHDNFHYTPDYGVWYQRSVRAGILSTHS